jgi:hypothetical protein
MTLTFPSGAFQIVGPSDPVSSASPARGRMLHYRQAAPQPYTGAVLLPVRDRTVVPSQPRREPARRGVGALDLFDAELNAQSRLNGLTS